MINVFEVTLNIAMVITAIVFIFGVLAVIVVPWLEFVITGYWKWCEKIKRGINK